MVKETLNEHDFKFKKKFGQNFISDSNLLNAITADAKITENDFVLEIGTGAGTLTEAISKKAKTVVTVEIDEALKPILEKKFSGISNIKLIFNDILKLTEKEIISLFSKEADDDQRPFSLKVVANLPYYITTPIVFKLLEFKSISSITVMVQKEVAERFCAKPKTKEYGIIPVKLFAYGTAKIARVVNRKMFNPVPNVDSAILHIEIKDRKNKIKDINKFNNIVNTAFSMRRKTLVNNLLKLLPKQKIEEAFASLNLSSTARAEELTPEEFINLTNLL